MILWPVMDKGHYQVLPWSLPSLRPYFSRTASLRAARTAHRRRNCQSRPVEPVKACAPARQTLASDGSMADQCGPRSLSIQRF